MQTFAMLTRLEPDGLQSPTAVEDLEHRVMEQERVACPTAQWICSYTVCGPYDHLDLFCAQDLDDATEISAIVRSYGHAHTELWPLTEWSHFKTVIHELGLVRPSAGARGSGRFSPRNNFVAQALPEAGLARFLFDRSPAPPRCARSIWFGSGAAK
jgi:hypothetical protein